MGTPPSLADEAAFADYLARVRILAITTKLVDTLYVAGFLIFLAGLPAFGAIGFVLTALFLVAVSGALRAAQSMPCWFIRLGFANALLNVTAVPTIYGGETSWRW